MKEIIMLALSVAHLGSSGRAVVVLLSTRWLFATTLLRGYWSPVHVYWHSFQHSYTGKWQFGTQCSHVCWQESNKDLNPRRIF